MLAVPALETVQRGTAHRSGPLRELGLVNGLLHRRPGPEKQETKPPRVRLELSEGQRARGPGERAVDECGEAVRQGGFEPIRLDQLAQRLEHFRVVRPRGRHQKRRNERWDLGEPLRIAERGVDSRGVRRQLGRDDGLGRGVDLVRLRSW